MERVDEYHDRLVEECCEGAVVMRFDDHMADLDGYEGIDHEHRFTVIPVAQSVPSLAVAVAVRLLREQFWSVEGQCLHDPSPFAAAYYDRAGVRTYVLASGECEVCEGARAIPAEIPDDLLQLEGPSIEAMYRFCPQCEGAGARTDVKSIADRYQPDRPWRDEDTPRLARFEVRNG
jgi:hypothetical protein